jgi:hypothetical protein
MLEAQWQTAKATALLLWWYAREKSDEETASKEWKSWFLNPEDDEPTEASWPHTDRGAWCGEWELKDGPPPPD